MAWTVPLLAAFDWPESWQSWRDAEAFRFQLADPETGAVRMLSLSDREVDLLSERFGELVNMPNQSKITFLTSKLPVLLSGSM